MSETNNSTEKLGELQTAEVGCSEHLILVLFVKAAQVWMARVAQIQSIYSHPKFVIIPWPCKFF